jgi:diguanylate cyclase (GGDEF)-like protein
MVHARPKRPPLSRPCSPNGVFGTLLQNLRVNPKPTPPPLLRLLTWPYLVVVVALAIVVAGLAHRAALRAVDHAAQQWLGTALERVGDHIDHQQRQADQLLHAAWPDGSPPPSDLAVDPSPVVQRLWMAVLLHPQERGRIRLLTKDGQALSVQRLSKQDAVVEIRRGRDDPVLRQVVGQAVDPSRASSASAATLMSEQTRRDDAWLREALRDNTPSWSSVELDSSEGVLSMTRVRPLRDATGQVTGALAATFTTQHLQDALTALKLPAQGVAFVVERDGLLVASSTGSPLRKATDGSAQRVHVTDSGSPVMQAAYERVLPLLANHTLTQPGRAMLSGSDLGPLAASFGRLTAAGGNDWALVVAAPRSALTEGLTRAVVETVAATLAAVAVVLLIAAGLRRRLVQDMQALSGSLQTVANGDLDSPMEPMHCAELDTLSDDLRRAQMRLRNDRSLGLSNREGIVARLHDRMRPGRRHNDAPLVALLAVDLNRFKDVNRVHGHDAGDFVLQTIGKRLRQTVRDTDMVVRWSSDEFLVMLDGVASAEDAARVRDQVERVLRDPVELGPGKEAVEIDGTAGLAVVNVNDETSEPDVLLRHAQADLAQRKPPDRYRFDPPR